eukprot:995023-Rhodomonas_salina.1
MHGTASIYSHIAAVFGRSAPICGGTVPHISVQGNPLQEPGPLLALQTPHGPYGPQARRYGLEREAH